MIGRLNLLSSIRGLPRDLRFLFASIFLFTFGIGLYNYVWSIYLRELRATPGDVGLVFSVGFIAGAATMIPGGILANKYELRTLLIISGFMGVPPPIIYYFATNWTQAVPGVILLQISGFSIPAFNAYIVGASKKEAVTSAFGVTWSAGPMGIVFSPAIGSLLLTWFPIRDLFLIAFVFLTLSTIVLFPMKKQPPVKEDEEYPRIELPGSSAERTLLVFIVVSAFAFTITSPFLPLFFQDLMGLGGAQIQLLGATQSLGSALFAILLGKRAEAHSHGRAMSLGMILSTAGLFGIGLLRPPILVFPLVLLYGGARGATPVAYSVLSKVGKNGSRAGKFGLFLTLETLGFVGGSYLGGKLYSVDPTIVLFSSSLIFLALAGLSGLGIRAEKLETGDSEVPDGIANNSKEGINQSRAGSE